MYTNYIVMRQREKEEHGGGSGGKRPDPKPYGEARKIEARDKGSLALWPPKSEHSRLFSCHSQGAPWIRPGVTSSVK